MVHPSSAPLFIVRAPTEKDEDNNVGLMEKRASRFSFLHYKLHAIVNITPLTKVNLCFTFSKILFVALIDLCLRLILKKFRLHEAEVEHEEFV
ncbi:hypothetical protein RRG08_011288 [Elysia crispata]|uniref:Uncharacterized protein n=1 Tax=Elysia crispata TaxID=231223 RepID=A0AAE1DIX6_9GAST|nr:hypothetical protein RRG08_011288 [Elysia crispata]